MYSSYSQQLHTLFSSPYRLHLFYILLSNNCNSAHFNQLQTLDDLIINTFLQKSIGAKTGVTKCYFFENVSFCHFFFSFCQNFVTWSSLEIKVTKVDKKWPNLTFAKKRKRSYLSQLWPIAMIIMLKCMFLFDLCTYSVLLKQNIDDIQMFELLVVHA